MLLEIAQEPIACIYCGGADIGAEPTTQIGFNSLSREVICNECKGTWREYFQIHQLLIPNDMFGKVLYKASEDYGMKMVRNYYRTDVKGDKHE